MIRFHFLFAVLSQTSEILLSKFQLQKPSKYKQLWGLKSDTKVYFSHTVNQDIYIDKCFKNDDSF